MIRSLIGAAALAAILSPLPVFAQEKPAAPGATRTLALPGISAAKAERRRMVERLVVSGNLVARDEVLVAPEVDGLRVMSLHADEGDKVEAGQVLARLSRDTLEAQMAQNAASITRAEAAIAQANDQIPQADAALTEAKAALARTVALRESGNATLELLDQRTAAARTAEARVSATRNGLAIAQADKASAEAQRHELALKLARTELKAPVAGIVSRRTVRLGALSSLTGDPMFRIIANGEVELEAEVLETHLAGLKPGARVLVTPVGGKTIEGTVRLMPAEVDRSTRLGLVRIALPRDPDLRIGAFARADIVVAERDGIAVPTSALLFSTGTPRVQVVKDGRVETRDVKTGITADGRTEILSGLAEGESVVAKAAPFLRNGDAVRQLSADAGKTAAPETTASTSGAQ
jgi:RND family efflux transporter MFP subunit